MRNFSIPSPIQRVSAKPRVPAKGDHVSLIDVTQIATLIEQLQTIYKKYEAGIAELSQKEQEIIAHAKNIQKGDKGNAGTINLSLLAQQLLPLVVKQLPSGDPGEPGKDADEQAIIAEIKTWALQNLKGKDGDPGADGSSVSIEDTAKEVIDLLLEKKLLTVDHIKGLPQQLSATRNSAMLSVGGMRGGQGSWKVKNLSGIINSNNTVFTASGEKPADNSHHVMLNYQEQNPLTDYTVTWAAGQIIVTYATAPDISLSGLPHYIRYQ